jgi:Right handed beta helix region
MCKFSSPASIFVGIILNGLTLAIITPTYAATFTVQNSSELLSAIQESNRLAGRDQINLAPGIFELTDSLTITDSVGISGTGANATLIQGGNSPIRGLVIGNSDTNPIVNIFGLTIRDFNSGGIFVNKGSSLSLSGSTITRNSSSATLQAGGGILNDGFLQIFDSTISGNTSSGFRGGGGIANGSDGSVEIDKSTISGNVSPFRGGGILNGGGSLSITNSTISGNEARVSETLGGGIYSAGTVSISHSTITNNRGGGINNVSGVVSLGNTILAENANDRDCVGEFTSFRNNLVGFTGQNCTIKDTIFGDTRFDLVGTSSLLAQLADNGGSTQTHALLFGSPAIDAARFGTSARFFDCPRTDQRGAARPFDGNGDGVATCDIGAFEFGASLVKPPVSVPEPTSILGLLAIAAFGGSSLLKRK